MIHQDDLPDNIFREHRIEQPIFLEEDFTKGETTFGPKQIGTTTNPMASPLESFKAKLREGVGKIEFGFLGSGKTSSQQPSPEAVSAEERLALRNLVRINKVRTSTHAAVHMGGLGGFNPESGSFSDAARGRTLREIERAVDFAADATDGGAIVFHVGEFTRPVSEIKEKTGDKLFETYEDEGKTGQELIVDTTTGKVTGLPKDQPIIIPKWTLAKDKGLKVGQKYESVNGDQVVLREGDYIDQIGRIIPRYDLNNYDKRIPEGELSKDKYETEELNWEKLGKRAEQENKYIAQWNKEHPDKQVAEVTAAVLFARLQKEQQLLQAEGQINYYQQGYEGYIRRLEEEKKIPEYEKEIETLSKIVRDEKVPQKDRENYYQRLIQLQNRVDSIPEEVRDARRHFSHAHASVTAATAQREQAKKEWNALQDPETYAVKRAAETIAKVGMETYYKTKQIKPKEAFFAAPEHWAIESFGSHPEELKKLVLSSREQMVKQLVKTGVNEEEAKKLAKTHIKATIDTGHLNMWRSRFKRNPGESAEDRDKRYHKWYLEHMEKLAKEGIVGHAHLADNFGWDDEHLTPGQGNAPIKETMKIFERFGMNDTVVEPGSFNPLTAMPETWRMLGSPIYAVSQPGRSSWRSIYQADSGFGRAPSQYMQGEYVPSKENWQLWSQTPLE
ncbi:MAG: hypothetical protein H6502_03795 [Candidatus Woesearchaeota archaeon]|nr:MAG: hypothetical protein H6502_03795 [Candidatus Woesearchaeota archaeon]